MIESWVLADKELLKSEIGTKKTDTELGIQRPPESIADPKQVIEDAIRIGRQDLPKKRRKDLVIADLYQIMGSSMPIEKLDALPSFVKFKEGVREAFRVLNYLR